MHPEIVEIVRIDSVDEANRLLRLGWVLLETGSFVVDSEPHFYFLLGKTALLKSQEAAEELFGG